MSAKQLKSDPSDIRAKNIRTAFRLITDEGMMSRAELGRRMGLSRMAIGDLVKEMVERHLLRQAGHDRRIGRGKRSMMLTVDTDYWRVASVDVSQRFVLRGALTDLRGRIVERIEVPCNDTGRLRLEMVDTLCRRLLTMADGALLGLGVAVPGVVDADGVVVRSVVLDWTKLALKAHFEEEYQIPTKVCNDVNMGLLGECTFGEGSANSMFLSIGQGVGSGVCLNGMIVDGSGYSAGEIGHVVVDPEGPQCPCGKRGCLEMMINAPSLNERIDSEPDRRDEILAQSGKLLGNALAMSVSLLDLSDISVAGPAQIVGTVFLGAMRKELKANTIVDYRRQPMIHRCEQGDDLVLRGQAVEVIRSFVDSIHWRKDGNSKSQKVKSANGESKDESSDSGSAGTNRLSYDERDQSANQAFIGAGNGNAVESERSLAV